MDRFELERAMDLADGPRSPEKSLFYTLCRRINHASGTILPEHQPSLTELQRGAGLCRTAVRNNLHRLEVRGWITTYPPDPAKARREHARTRYVLHKPGSEEHTRARALQPAADRRPARRARLAAQQQRAQAAREQLAAAAVEEMAAAGRTVTPEQGAEIARQILAGRDIRPAKREVYLRKAVRADPRRYAPDVGSAPPPLPRPESTPAPPSEEARQLLSTVRTRRKRR